MTTAPGDITILLRQWSAGAESAREQLLPLVYDGLRREARFLVRRESRLSITATGLVHRLYVRLAGYEAPQIQDRNHFTAFCAHVMRQIVTDDARAVLSQKRGAGRELLELNEALAWVGERDSDWIDLDRAVEELKQTEPEKVRIVELRFYLGCSAEECAEILDLSKATVDRHWAFLRAWFHRRLRPAAPEAT